MTIRTIATLTLLLLVSAALSFSQGLYWESNTTSPMLKEKTLHSTFSYMPGMMRQASAENGTATIFRLDRKVIVSINEHNKTYSEMTFDEIESAVRKKGEGIDKQKNILAEKMKNLPEEKRKMMEKMLGSASAGDPAETPVTVTKTAEAKTISGYACTQYVLHQGEKTIMTVWATKDIAGYAAMQKELQEFGRRMASLNAANGKSLADAMKEVVGFPIMTQIGETLTTTVIKVESRPTSHDMFEVPNGYQKTPSPYLQP